MNAYVSVALAVVASLTSVGVAEAQRTGLVTIAISNGTVAGQAVRFMAVGTRSNLALASQPATPIDSISRDAPVTIVADLLKGPVVVSSRELSKWVSVVITSANGQLTASGPRLLIHFEKGSVIVKGL